MEPAADEGAAHEDVADGAREAAAVPAPSAQHGGGSPRTSSHRGVEAGIQADSGSELTSYDLKWALKLLHATDDTVVRRTPRRHHMSFWHAASAKLIVILRVAGASQEALKLGKGIVDTCMI